jgi:CheY-like chemotaxis protein
MTAPISQLDPTMSREIVVVDPRQSDYDCLLLAAAADGCEVRFFATGRDALRRRREMRAGLVIVNVALPDRSGFDLVEMLQPFPEGAAVFLVADRYAEQDELRALRLGVSSYLCKPLPSSLLHDCRSWSMGPRACRPLGAAGSRFGLSPACDEGGGQTRGGAGCETRRGVDRAAWSGRFPAADLRE